MQNGHIIEYWENGNCPSTLKTSPGFKEYLYANLSQEAKSRCFANPYLSQSRGARPKSKNAQKKPVYVT